MSQKPSACSISNDPKDFALFDGSSVTDPSGSFLLKSRDQSLCGIMTDPKSKNVMASCFPAQIACVDMKFGEKSYRQCVMAKLPEDALKQCNDLIQHN